MRNVFCTLVFCCLLFTLQACQTASNPHLYIKGLTMGTSYNIKYTDEAGNGRNLKKELDKILHDFDQSLSTYNPKSIITQLNQAEAQQKISIDDYFLKVYQRATIIHTATNGAFDPTIMPLVNFWGFGYQKEKRTIKKETANVDSLLALVGMQYFSLQENPSDKSKAQISKTK